MTTRVDWAALAAVLLALGAAVLAAVGVPVAWVLAVGFGAVVAAVLSLRQ